MIIFHVQLMERNAKTDSPIQLGRRVMASVSPIRRPSLELQRERERERDLNEVSEVNKIKKNG